ncbi:uncharacterized protein N7458_002558 [Penicillium daleae]|uniref:Uncharacterized protein n=1 Tax=Penicillium daleae TaxID=63821 RepID=A0AAD6CDU4_9EURO|nr:uncharacterized protein N7458_002516 [Penicillium daleae]XP_056770048.1 uncharacterized protein N7458_002558 [Penicillium daleae]KAJ5460964.1 hypothetical protein N7458_002516 [Penicillium daleae]KAJ5461006.1 hypothetical protein N7458_002558 [Penicillium daleae]
MNTNGKFDCALRSLDQVIGDVLHREACMWMDEDGKRCQNIVSKSSRVDGANADAIVSDLENATNIRYVNRIDAEARQKVLLRLLYRATQKPCSNDKGISANRFGSTRAPGCDLRHLRGDCASREKQTLLSNVAQR